MVDRLKRLARGVDAWLLRHRWTRIGRRAVIGFLQHEALQNAGAMAYFSVLSVFQLLVLAVVVLSFVVGAGDARRFVIDRIATATPLGGETIGTVIDAIIASRGGISLFGLIFLIWGALGLFSAVSKGISTAFVAGQPRPFLQDKLLGLALMSVTGLLGASSIAFGVVTGIIQQAADSVLADFPGGGLAVAALGLAVPMVLIFIAFLVLYRLVPNRRVTLGEVWPGALVATVLWTILRVGFTWYATSVANYESAFGPISTAITLLVFLYFASVVVLLGAEVARASVLEREEQEEARRRRDAAVATLSAWSAAAADDSGGAAPGRDTRPLPGWAMAIGGAMSGLLMRLLRRRRSR